MRKSILLTLFTIILGSTSLIPVKAQDLVYVPVDPCRIVDTRNAGGAIIADGFRNFLVSGTVGELAVQGGTTNCLDPKAGTGLKPLAISAYVLAVPATNSTNGVLTAYPSDQPPPPAGAGSTVNFAAGQVIGNTTNITLCASSTCPTNGEFAILARRTNQHVVIDVQGYFYQQVLNVDSVRVSTESDANVDSSFNSETLLATCPTGSIMSGGGVKCSSDNDDFSTTNFGLLFSSIPSGNSYLGTCFADALTFSSDKFGPPVTVYAVCLSDEGAVTAQSASVGTGVDSQGQLPQGEPSEEALLLLESLRKESAARDALVNSVN